MADHIHYCHGLESGPHGFKVRTMRAWGVPVAAPDMQMSVWSPRARSGILRSLPGVVGRHRPDRWLAAAVGRSRDACVLIQQQALAAAEPPAVLVGSSWGGMVAAILLAEGRWRGPTILLCPALRLIERWMVPSGPLPGPRCAEAVAAALATLPPDLRAQCVLVHGTADATIPLADSRWLAETTGIRLVEIPEGTHGLGRVVADGRLRTLVTSVVPDLIPADGRCTPPPAPAPPRG